MPRWMHGSFVVIALACGGQARVGPPPTAAATEPDARQRARDAELVARATPYVDAFTNSIPSLAPDGRVVFVSSRDGLPQLYVGTAAEPDRAPTRLPVPAERVVVPQLLPDGKTIVFLSDVGADQRFHLFRIGLDGTGLADLTPAGELRRAIPQIARRAGTLVYGAHTLEDQATRVFAHTVDTAPREIYRDPRVGRITDVSADGTRALYLRSLSDTDQILFVIATAGGAPTRLYPPVGQVAKLGDAAFTADGASVVTAREVTGRPLRVLRLDAATGAEQAHHDEATALTAPLSQIAVSPRGEVLIVALDAGEHTELRALDPRDLHALPAPAIPLAAIDLGVFTDDGSRLPLTIRAPDAPADIAALEIASGTIVPLRREPRAGLGTPPHASIEHVRAFDGLSIPVNVYLPEGARGRLPTFVLVHGGPTGNASLSWSATIGFWTAMGFAVIAPNIRGSSGYGIAYEQADDREHRIDALHDMESVNRWARAQPWCDGDRIVIGGISYGGYMTCSR
jgi:dipeptidyl aminopeptidase/acylaminoacyl peptidase